MEKIITAYYYIFYRFYLFASSPPSRSNADWSAAALMAIIESCLYYSIVFYYRLFHNQLFDKPFIKASSPVFFIPMGAIIISKYFAFLRSDAWIDYYNKFEELPDKVNRKWGIILFCAIIVICSAFALSIYLFNKDVLSVARPSSHI